MFCSLAGALFDYLGYIHPVMTQPHDGMMFSTLSNDYDTMGLFNCALSFGGGWWFTQCSIWCPTVVNPVWLNMVDSSFNSMENVHMMVKLQ